MFQLAKFLLILALASGCSGTSIFGGGETNNKASDDTKKPSDGDVGVPGYLVDPNQIVILKGKSAGDLTFIGKQGVVKNVSGAPELSVVAILVDNAGLGQLIGESGTSVTGTVLASAFVNGSSGFRLPLPALAQAGLVVLHVSEAGDTDTGFVNMTIPDGFIAVYLDTKTSKFIGIVPGTAVEADEKPLDESGIVVTEVDDGTEDSALKLPADVPEASRAAITECFVSLFGQTWPAAPGAFRLVERANAAAIKDDHNIDDPASAAPGIVHVRVASDEEIKGAHFNLMQPDSIYCLDVTAPSFDSNTIDRACGVQVHEGIDAGTVSHVSRHEKC